MEETMNDVEVRNNPAEYRYEVFANGELAGYTQYVLDRGRIAFLHTEVYEPHESLGLGTQLTRVALDDARARSLPRAEKTKIEKNNWRSPTRGPTPPPA